MAERCEQRASEPVIRICPCFGLSLSQNNSIMSSNPVQLRAPSPPQLASPKRVRNINVNISDSVRSS